MSWPIKPVKDVAELAIGPFGSALKADTYVSVGMPVVAGGNLGGGRWPDVREAPRVSSEAAARLSRSVALPGDLIFPHRGSIGRVGIANRELMLSTSMMRARFDSEIVDSEFAYWFFLAQGSRELLTMASSVGTPGIGQPLASLGSVRISVPPIRVQKGLVAVLGALDDKIAANRVELEASDGVIRAMYIRLPLSNLTLGYLAENVRISVKVSEITNGDMYVGLEHLDRRSLWVASRGVGAVVASNKTRFAKNDVLFGKLRPYFHKVGLATSEGVCSTDILVIRARKFQDVALVAAAASSDAAVNAAVQASNGTKMPRAKWADIAACAVPDPDTAEAREFCVFVGSLVKRAAQLIEESRRLAATRDELLPLLMSGKITVKDAEKTVEEVI